MTLSRTIPIRHRGTKANQHGFAKVLNRNSSLAIVTVGLLATAIAVAAPARFSLVCISLLLCMLLAITLKLLDCLEGNRRQPEMLQCLIDLSSDDGIATAHSSMAQSMRNLSSRSDPIFRELADTRLQKLTEECSLIGNGKVSFQSTESWRVAYEALLRSPGTHIYRSVAYVESAHYWQDGPGQQSTQLNMELQDQRIVAVERTAIVADHLWPMDELFPCDPLHSWLEQQHRHGILLRLVRESQLEHDTDLLSDIGIYGSRAVGIQTADPSGRTIHFVLDFNFETVQTAEMSWNRLGVYATSYSELLDKRQ